MGPPFDYEVQAHVGAWTDREEAWSQADDDGVGPDGQPPKERKGSKWTPVATRPNRRPVTASGLSEAARLRAAPSGAERTRS